MDNENLFNRFVDLETSYGLLQRDFEKQNEAILWLTKRLSGLEKTVEKLHSQLENVETLRTPTNPVDEKPPHY